jgi:hypothetical protein
METVCCLPSGRAHLIELLFGDGLPEEQLQQRICEMALNAESKRCNDLIHLCFERTVI